MQVWMRTILAESPGDAGSGAVAVEAKQAMGLAAVESIDGVVEPGSGVDVAADRQRIVDVIGPAFFFKRVEDHFLVLRRDAEPLDDLAVQTELAPHGMPARLEGDVEDLLRVMVMPGPVITSRSRAVLDGRRIEGLEGCRNRHRLSQETIDERGTARGVRTTHVEASKKKPSPRRNERCEPP